MSSEGIVVMGWLRTSVVCGAVLAISGASALGADMPDYPSLPMPKEKSFPVDSLISGWYLRGDVGYRFQRVGAASDLFTEYTTSSIKDTYVGAIGAGYKANWLRTDITGDYGWRTIYSGSTDSGANTVSAKIESFNILLNGYLDLGTWSGFTPYVGAGIGGAQVSTRNYETRPPQPTVAPQVARWNLAWAAMAGVSVNLTYNILLDIGYRHIDMGDVVGGSPPNELKIKKLTGDEVRVGLRFVLD
jgi:opacity protein-like surface antigen